MNHILDLIQTNWKILFITVLAGFLMAILPKLGVTVEGFSLSGSTASIISPLPAEEDPLKLIYPRLERKMNEFELTRESSIIPEAHAGGIYDDANAYVVIDFDTGKVIAEKDSRTPVAIASLTKVMTAVTALDLVLPEEEIVVSEAAQEMIPTKIGVVAGQKLTLNELLHALMMTSANDAAEVIKDGVNTKYGKDVFVKAMNAKAQFLGLQNTHFENPQGFDGDEHYSSAEDLAVLTHYAMVNYPLIAQVSKKDYLHLASNQSHKQFDLYNWNGLLEVYPGTMGVKIGNTGRAKKTTIVLSERGGRKVMAVLLGAPGVLERDLWTANLLDLAFETEFGLPPVKITEAQLKEKYASWKSFN